MAAEERKVDVKWPEAIRRGHIVACDKYRDGKPIVALVLSIWLGHKKPKLSTKDSNEIRRVAGVRVVEMVPDGGDGSRFCGSSASDPYLLRPEQLISILDCEESNECSDSVSVVLSQKSVELLNALKGAAKWWPGPDPSLIDQDKWQHSKPQPKRRQRKIRMRIRGSKGKNGGKKHAKATTKDANKKKKKQSAQKQAKPISFQASKFRKNAEGRKLVQETMLKIRLLDAKKFPSKPVFDSMNLCKLPVEKVFRGQPSQNKHTTS